MLPTSQDDGASSLSKSQLKKQKRRQNWLDSRSDRRKLEREKRKIKRRELALNGPPQREFQSRRSFTLMSNSANKFKIVIDLDFQDYMTDSEIGKSVQQVGRIYALNRHSENPCQLYVSSLKDKILEKFAITNTGYQNWDINYSELDYASLLGCEQDKSNLIYLSGDADDSLPDVDTLLKDDSKVFVIGGLVDHNRHKNLCQKRALESGIKTAKLPIKDHVNLCQRHVLSTVTVFEIMLNVLGNHKQWPEALRTSIPKRKIAPEVDKKTDRIERTTDEDQ